MPGASSTGVRNTWLPSDPVETSPCPSTHTRLLPLLPGAPGHRPSSWQYAWPSQHSLWHRFLPASKLSPPCTRGSCGSESPLSAVRVWSAHAGWMWARASPPPSLHASCPHCPGANPNFAQELEIYCRAFGLSPIHP